MRKNKTESQKERKIRSQCVIEGEQNEETVVEPSDISLTTARHKGACVAKTSIN